MLGIPFRGSDVLALLALLLATSGGQAQETRKKIADYAERLPFLATNALFSYDRYVRDDLDRLTYIDVPLRARTLYREIMEEMVTADFPTQDLRALLHDEEPHVRTLALVALFAKEDLRVLPDIYALVKDPAPTFGAPPMNRSAFMSLQDLKDAQKMPPLKPQTVGDVAGLAIKACLDVANVPIYVKKGQMDLSGFESYWAARKDRTSCATWWELRWQRVTQGITPMRPQRIPFLKALRREIDRLPPDERTWTLLWLSDHASAPAGEHLVSVKELIALSKQLGQDRLLAMLAGAKISDDPDMQVRPGIPGGRNSMRRFVLHHAGELFDRKAGDALQKIEAEGRASYPTPWWSIALAELQPEKAPEILHAALRLAEHPDQDNQHRSELAQALWRLAGSAESKYLLDWFYGEKADPGPDPHGHFLKEVAQHRAKENRPFLARLVRDPRFDQLNWHTLDQLIHLLNTWSEQPIVSADELRNLQHPLGTYHFSRSVQAHASYPRQTAQVQQTLAQWRQKVRASVPQWNP